MEDHILNTRYGIDDEQLFSLAEAAKDFASCKGILFRSPELPRDARAICSFCLLPSLYPKKYFEKAYKLQTYMNAILYRISLSKDILKECLSSTIEADEFTRNIFKIYEAVEHKEQICLGLIRSDYLLHSDSKGKLIGLKQVENNTISVGFGSISPIVKDLHVFVLDRLGQKGFDDKLPLNESGYGLAKGLVSAWDAYDCSNAIILFVVEEEVSNICDQRHLEHAVLDFENKIEIIRCTFTDLKKNIYLKEDKLYVKDKEVAVVYYRVGYDPDHYKAEDWETRLLIEQSRAIKCPSAGLQLAGTKKVQAYLIRPGVLEKFVNSDIAEEIREMFAGQYLLEMGPDGDEAIHRAIENPEKFVLKPEREGGGNNVYGSDIKSILENILTSEERNSYILMDYINSPIVPNCVIKRNKSPEVTNVIPELGIYGVIMGNKESIYVNEFAGHILRSKTVDTEECGIVAGYGLLDSPYLD